MENKLSNNRLVYLDYLRVVATVAILLIHLVAAGAASLPTNSFDWHFFNICNSISRWGTPVFIMISGALFLGRELPLDKLYKKYILRIAMVYFLWNIIYIMVYGLKGPMKLENIINILFLGEFHMWFLPMIIGIYMCVPFLNPIVKDKQLLDYFLSIGFVFALVLPEIYALVMNFGSGFIVKLADSLFKLQAALKLNMITSLIFYFVFGYYVNTYEIPAEKRRTLYILGLLGMLATILLTVALTNMGSKINYKFYERGTLNVAFEAMALFVFFKYASWNNSTINSIIAKLSKYTFGVYLMHIAVRNGLNNVGIYSVKAFGMSACPALLIKLVITCAICFGLSFVLKQIPMIKKWIY